MRYSSKRAGAQVVRRAPPVSVAGDIDVGRGPMELLDAEAG